MTSKLKERFDALSDAIIAIVMTILVLEIKLPTSMDGLPHFAYTVGLFLISFLIFGIGEPQFCLSLKKLVMMHLFVM